SSLRASIATGRKRRSRETRFERQPRTTLPGRDSRRRAVNRFLSRLGDRINPIVVKESRQAVNSRIVAAFLLLFLTVEMVVMLLLISEREVSSEINMHAGREIFSVVQGVLLGTCMILIPTMTGARLAGERSDVNVDLLFISSLSPRAVLFGKLAAAGAL